MTQYHYLDDSGDPGLSGAKGSSTHFALAMIQLAERAPVSQLAKIRRQFHFPATFEFKYFKSKPKHKQAFFEAIRPVPFRVRAVIVDKSRLPDWLGNRQGDALAIELLVRLILRTSQLDIANDTLIIDDAKPEFRRKLRIRLSQRCRELGRVRPFGLIVGADSSKEDGLQIADMIAGAMRHYVIGDESEYYHSFADKVVDFWQVRGR